jgi:hypothetical protein
MQSLTSSIYLSSNIFNGRIVLGKKKAFDNGKIGISVGRLFFLINYLF